MNASTVSKGILQQLRLYVLGAAVASAAALSGNALGADWDYANVPLFWSTGATPNVALLIDDSGSMAAIVAGEAYQKAHAANAESITRPWYWCTGTYDITTKRCKEKGSSITYFNVYEWKPPGVSEANQTINRNLYVNASEDLKTACSSVSGNSGFAKTSPGTSTNTNYAGGFGICLQPNPFPDGAVLKFSSAPSGGSTTLNGTYYVVNSINKGFQLSTTFNGPPVTNFSVNTGTGGSFTYKGQKTSGNLPTYIASDSNPPAAVTVALCDVTKAPGTPGYFIGNTGTSPWLSSNTLPTASTVGVMVSDNNGSAGTRDSCVRWKMLTTANSATVAPGNKDYSVNWTTASPYAGANLGTAYLAPGGEKDSDATKTYARYLLNTFIWPLSGPAASGEGNFDGNPIYLDTDPHPKTYDVAEDKYVIPRVTRMQAVRESVQQIVLDNYTRMNIGLFSFKDNSGNPEMNRAIKDGSNPEADKLDLVGPNYSATVEGTQDGKVGALVPNANTPLEGTQTYINEYFKDGKSPDPSPIQYRCQKNYTVILTDGLPSSRSETAMQAAAKTGYDTDCKPTGNDVVNGSYQDPKFPKQNVETFTVGFGLENNVLKRTPLVNRVDVEKSDIVGNVIKLKKTATGADVPHGLDTGDYVQVVSGAAGGLTNGNYYYAVKVDSLRFRLAAASAAGDTGTSTANNRQKAFDCAASAPGYTAASGCISVTGGAGTMVLSTGPGKAMFAQTPEQLSDSLGDVFNRITALTSSASAVSTNSKQLGTDTLVYQARFNTEDWSGEVAAYEVNPVSGAVNTKADPAWTTKQTLNTKNATPINPATRNMLTWNRNTGQASTFDTLANIGAINSAALNDDLNALRWIRGNDIITPAGFRSHTKNGLVGDIINADPVFVGALNWGYNTLPPSPVGCSASTCTGAESYSTYLANRKTTATPMLFVATNGGQLHALNATNGTEIMSFIPGGVYENWNDANNNNVKDVGEVEKKLYNLTQSTYDHRYFVDGAGATSDVFIGNSWKTYFVGTLGGGGRSVYAIDASDDSFDASDIKWEFNHPNLGYTYGKPTIARFSNNKWYAVFPNGTDSYQDRASVFAVNIADVTDFHELTVSNGDSPASPNGMMTLAISQDGSRTAQFIYAGDMKGNIWKFDVSTGAWPTGAITPLFTATDPGGLQQSITGGIRIGKNPAATGNLVYFGTGKYFEYEDRSYESVSVPQVDTFYAVFDDGTMGVTRLDLQQQTFAISATGNRVMPSPQPVDYDTQYGWFVDLLEGTTKKGERMVSTPVLSGGRIIFVTIVPSGGDKCVSVGSSWLNELDALTGKQIDKPVLDADGNGVITVDEEQVSGIQLEGMASEPTILQGADGETEKKIMGSTSVESSIITVTESSAGSAAVGGAGRMSWQQIQ